MDDLHGDFTLHLSIGNDAMRDPRGIASALRSAADKVDTGQLEGGIRDDNGNTVGNFRFSAD